MQSLDGQPQDPALRAANLRYDRARLVAAIGSDEAYEALQQARRDAADAQRAAQKEALARIDQLLSEG